MTTVNRYDVIGIKAVVTADGFIRDRPILTRSGIFQYKDAFGKMVREYRPPEEVFKEDSLATIVGIPITDLHNGMVSADNTQGILGTVISAGIKQDENVVADIVIHDTKRLGNKRELSLGYKAVVLATPGTTPTGEKYDTIQTDIKYNHLAVVHRGRAGNARLHLDRMDASSFDIEDETMEPRLTTVRLDNGIEYQAAQEVAQAFVKLVDEAKRLKTEQDQKQAELDSLKNQSVEMETALASIIADSADYKGKPVALAKEVAEQFKTLPARIRARSELEETAKKRDVKFDAKDTDRQIREKIVTKIRGDSIKFDDKSDDYVASAYDLAIVVADDKTKKVGEQRQTVVKQDSSSPKMGGANAARARMVANIRAGR